MIREIQTCTIGLALATMALWVAFCLAAEAQAQPGTVTGLAVRPVSQPNGDIIVLPSTLPGSRQNGFTLNVDTRWINAYGYRPIGVTISSPVATTAAHTITVRLHAGWDNVTTVVQEIEFPKGATIASASIPLPYFEQPIFGVWWELEVDGIKDRDLSLIKEDASRRAAGPNISASTIRALMPGTVKDRVAGTNSNADLEFLKVPLPDFPRRWIDYTCFDVVAVSLSELQQLAKMSPASLAEVARWVRAGGQLWVGDAGADLEKLPEISQLLHVPAALVKFVADPGRLPRAEQSGEKSEQIEAPVAQTRTEPLAAGWRPNRIRGGPRGQSQGFDDRRSGQTRWVNDPRVAAQLEQDPNFTRTNDAPSADEPDADRRWPVHSGRWYVEQRLGLGILRAYRGVVGTEPIAPSAQLANGGVAVNANGEPIEDQVPVALAIGLRSTRRWESRHGLIPDSGNSDFARLLIPGVGRAPVTEFQVLITLFVLLIGPFNYWILKRYKRSQLLVLTVPLAALAATGALFAYAIVSDGFDTKVRVRSYTTIDQSTGEAASWAWSSYYAGIAPSRGLSLPADAVLYPILPNWSGPSTGIDRTLIWSGDQALLTRGWLMSRTPTQYLIVRSRKTPYRLDVTSGNGKMQVVNRLGTQIKSLLALDESGNFFSGEELASESRTVLKPILQNDAVKIVTQWMRDNEAEKPPELSDSERDFFGRSGRSTRRVYNRYRPAGAESGQLNDNLASRALTDLAGLNGRPALELPVRTYVAVTETGPEVATGIPNANEEASFHVMVGHW